MLNARAFFNSRPDGFPVLELPHNTDESLVRSFVPLKQTTLTGTLTGPLATLTLQQTFAHPGSEDSTPVEALYRFPLPGDAAVTGVRVRFGTVSIQTELKERAKAEAEYAQANQQGQQAALVTRESPDVFTLSLTGIRPGEEIHVETEYVQQARVDRDRWSLRVPLTTAPRFVREDEAGSRHAQGQPLALLRDPGHRFALDLTIQGPAEVESPTHAVRVERTEHQSRVQLKHGEVLPDSDFVLLWRTPTSKNRPSASVWVYPDHTSGQAYFLAQCIPPSGQNVTDTLPREIILLVDHSGSMEGAKWKAADWAVERFLAGLTKRDSFSLGIFHNTATWFQPQPVSADAKTVKDAVQFLKSQTGSGGTNLGVAIEQALDQSRVAGKPSRHVLVLTDAEVSDAGRILRLADAEADRADRRRISVLCIDAAPNAALATELAERGGGVSRFLTSNPAEDDVTTALDDILADWAAPLRTGLTLEVNRSKAEAVGRQVRNILPGTTSGIDLGDLPAGRPVWVAGRVPSCGDSLAFHLKDGNHVELAESGIPQFEASSSLKALFGAERIRRLEYLLQSDQNSEYLPTELSRLGYELSAEKEKTGSKVYPENITAEAIKQYRDLLMRESLSFGLPCAETAFVAVRTEAGKRVGGTVVVANALPRGWNDDFISGFSLEGTVFGKFRTLACRVMPAYCDAMYADTTSSPLVDSSNRWSLKLSAVKRTGTETVLYDSSHATAVKPIPPAGRLTAILITASGVESNAIDPNCELLIYVGSSTSLRAKVRLADLVALSSRPLNLQWTPADMIRLVLSDPGHSLVKGFPELDVALEWE